ncbi:small ribosomal subunit protein uS14-like [Myotis daubentonii]|uniref:small ribosomal subunit protein uS14-like n=1 Tax=Myotis daubentonii TaxID=98922 RepID=UPI002872E9E3|nr:small ribosomal subunit protein uS14-like [Myotis daubentonii]
MGHQQLYWSYPRKCSQGSRSCCVCSRCQGLIRKYGFTKCLLCFRQSPKDIGFITLD